MKFRLRIVLVIVLAAICFACKKTSNDGCEPETFEFKFQNSKTIDTVRIINPDPTLEFYTYTVNTGNNLVFTYKHHYRDCPEIADDEGLETIIFEIPQQSDSFVLNDSLDFRSAKCLIHFSCFCAPGAPFFIKKGSIEGTRVGISSWKIKANLQMPWNTQSTVNFDNIFTLQ